MADLTQLLVATQNPSTRAQAEERIKAAENANVAEYFTALATELANPEKPAISRQLAGLLLKNGLAARDAKKEKDRDMELKTRWLNLPDAVRDVVKQHTTSALIAEIDVAKASAQVLAKIGAIEIPTDKWPGLVPLLLNHVTNQDLRARQISLVTLGYLCEELVVIQLAGIPINNTTCNNILTAVVQGMRDEDAETKLQATRAFYHAVVLAKENFERENERNMIMGCLHEICKFTAADQAKCEQVQIAGFECLVQVVIEYYDFVFPYIAVMGPLTWETIKSSSEKVAIPAMEFWSTICDEELELNYLTETGQVAERRSHNIVQQALPHLIPLLTETLTRKTNEEDDDDTWNIASAAGTCLDLVAQVVGDACVDMVLMFCGQHFGNADWRFREAALLAYGSIMEGPSSAKMQPVVQQTFEQLVQRFEDPSIAVRDTLAWTFGRIVQFHPAIAQNLAAVKVLIPVLGKHLGAEEKPRVVANVCWVIQVLAEAQRDNLPFGKENATTALSEFFNPLAAALLQVTMRQDAEEKQLRMRAYEALSSLVSNAGDDCKPQMLQLVEEMLNHLTASFQVPLTQECELQGYICGVLTACTQRLRQHLTPAADKVMEAVIQVVKAYQQAKGSPLAVKDEALLLAQAVAFGVGEQFDKYMQLFLPVWQAALENFEDEQVCNVATGMTSDLCLALKGKIFQYTDVVIEILLRNLQNAKVSRRIKATITVCFGDVAMAITGNFEKYLATLVPILHQAASTKITDGNPDDEDWVEYLNTLREGVLDAYSGIINGLKDAKKLPIFQDHVHSVLQFANMLTEDSTVQEPVLKAALGVVFDLVQGFKQELIALLRNAPFLEKLVLAARNSSNPDIVQRGQLLQSSLQKYGGC